MRILFFLILTSVISLNSCVRIHNKKSKTEMAKYKYTNQLINESSPYLLQHAHNPVNWYPWGKEALTKAKEENKLIIISIGYAACHWCHVMEHESFEDEEVAAFMNENFISIKVDREERPDIDQIYMSAVQLITGQGGWPLNCIALPDGRPIYGGTYFRKEQWLQVLEQVSDFVKQNPEKTESQARSLTQGVKSSELITLNTEKPDFELTDLNTIFSNWEKNIDYKNGGTFGAPKFPLPIGYQFLLHYNYLSNNKDALKAVTSTLDKMAMGGIYDQVGGGFARYSVDDVWKVPHFEKMLYDNAQLASLYSTAYQKTKDPTYKIIVEETLEFVKRELTSPEGGFYSSLDADSENEEGKFYVWKYEELQEILGEEAELIIDYYNVTKDGNWEQGKNILLRSQNEKALLNKYNISETELSKRVKEAKKILLKEREKRVRPGLDDKILTSWNALMLKAYVDAYKALGNQIYLDEALKSAEFINSKMINKDYRLCRNYKNGNATINAFLDDYAFTISALIELYQSTFDEKWLTTAHKLLIYAFNHFYNYTTGMFYYTSDMDPELIARKMELTDNVIPASNSEMAKNMFLLGKYFYKDEYIQRAEKMLNNIKPNTFKNGVYFANWNILMAWFIREPYEVAILGSDYENILKKFGQHYLPNVIFLGGKNEGSLSLLQNKLVKGQTTIYVCQNKTCKLPVTEVNRALKQIME